MDERLQQFLEERSERLEGSNSILEAFALILDITTWLGAKKYLRRHNIKIGHTPSGRPYVLVSDIVEHLQKEPPS